MINRIIVKLVLLGNTLGAWGGLILLAAGLGLDTTMGMGLSVTANIATVVSLLGILHSLWQDYQRLRIPPIDQTFPN